MSGPADFAHAYIQVSRAAAPSPPFLKQACGPLGSGSRETSALGLVLAGWGWGGMAIPWRGSLWASRSQPWL